MGQSTRPESRPGREPRVRRTPTSAAFQGALALSFVFVLVLVLGFRGGGGDLVMRQEVGLVVWVVLALAVLFGQLPRARPGLDMRAPGAAAVLLVAWAFAGLLWAPNIDDALSDVNRISLLVACGIVVLFGVSARNWRLPAVSLGLALAIITLAALGERLLPALVEAGGPLGGEVSRLSDPLDYWNAMASVAGAVVIAGLAAGSSARRGVVRGAALALVPAGGLALHLTYSRGGLVALAVGAGVLAAMAPQRGVLLRRSGYALALTLLPILTVRTQAEIADGSGGRGGWLVLLVLVMASVAAYLVGRGPRGPRLARSTKTFLRRSALPALVAACLVLVLAAWVGTERPASGDAAATRSGDPVERLVSLRTERLDLWASALRATSSSSLLGQGPGAYRVWWASDGGRPLVVDAHSLYLETLAELGLPGLTALLITLAALLRAALLAGRRLRGRQDRGLHAALVATFAAIAVQASVDWIWEVSVVAVAAVVAITLAIAPASAPRPPVGSLRGGRMLATAACLLAGAVQVPGLVSVQRARESEILLDAGAGELAVERARSAVSAAPWSPAAEAQVAQVAIREDLPEEALEAAERARDAAPADWRYWVLLARAAEASKDRALTVSALRQAAELRPGSGAAYYEQVIRAVRRGLPLPESL